MKQAIASLESISPYGQSKYYNVEKLNDKESHEDYEKRTWRERCHSTADGNIFIPPMAFKKSLEIAASYLSMKIPGQASAKYTKHFKSGILVKDPVVLPIKKKDVFGNWLFVPSNGVAGGGKRVMKCFPLIESWEGDVVYYILDEIITESVFLKTLEEAGNFIGIGHFRPERGGFQGRYKVNDFVWSEV